MIYSYPFTVAANVSRVNAVSSTITLSRGVITNWFVHIPPGVMSLAQFTISNHGRPIFPINLSGYMTGDNLNQSFSDFILITSEPYEIKLETWNLDDTYSHTILLLITMKQIWELDINSERFSEILVREDMRNVLAGSL